MNIREAYANIEDKWYEFLDSLDDKGLHVYKIIDPLEDKGIPSFPLFIGLVIILILALIWALMGSGPSATGGILNVVVTSNGKNLQGASISASLGGLPIASAVTGPNGAKLHIPKPGTIELTVQKDNCNTVTKTILFNGSTKTITISTNCSTPVNTNSCVNIPKDLAAIPLSTPSGDTPTKCQVYLIKQDGTTEKLDWDISDGQVLVTSGGCIPLEDKVRIDCYGYSGEFYPDELLSYAETGGSLILQPKSAEFSADQNYDNVPDWEESSNGWVDWNATGWNSTNWTESGWNTSYSENNTSSYPNWNGSYIGWNENGTVDDNHNGIPDTVEQDKSSQNEVKYTSLMVIVIDKQTGKRLNGIEVRAVDENGSLLPWNETNAVSKDGIAKLNVPRQMISLQAIDPNQTYATMKTPPFYPMGQVTLRMVKGWPSTIWVRQNDGRGLSGATVYVNGIKLYTDYQGKATISLMKGVQYQVYATKSGYKSNSGSIVGGGSVNITLDKLTDNNSGPLEIQVINPTKAGDPFPGVRIKLVSDDGTPGGECTTSTNGECTWDRIYATTYTVLARVPMSYNYTSIGAITVKPGRPNFYQLEANPTTKEIYIRTLVDGAPQNGIQVTLYTTYPDIEKVDTETSENSYVKFTGYLGDEYYIVGEESNDKGVYYGTIGPFKLDSTKRFTLNLEKPNVSVQFKLNGDTLPLGKRVVGKLIVGLPYLDSKMGTTYNKVIVKLWIGKPGDKLDPTTTPILIDRLPELVTMSETSQQPTIGLQTFSSYTNYLTGSTNPSTQTSKGLQITIKNYRPGSITFNIPLLVRLGALTGPTQVHYEAEYISNSASTSTGWKNKNITITGSSDWYPLPTGDFYLYKAGFTTNPNSTNWETSISATTGSIVYLHISALSKGYSKTGRFDFKITPEILNPIYFSGSITNANNTKTWVVFKTPLEGTDFNVMDATLARTLGPDYKVDITIAMNATTNGTAYIMPFYNEFQASSQDIPLTLKAKIKTPQYTPTPIANVEGNVTAYVLFTDNDIPLNYSLPSGIAVGEFNNNLPLFSTSQNVPRSFNISISLRNTGNVPYTGDLMVEAFDGSGNPINLGLQYPAQIEIPSGGAVKHVTITGVGPNEPTSGEIKIWLWQDGASQPADPWVTLKFEPNDYYIELMTNNTVNNKNIELENSLTEYTTSGEFYTQDANKRYVQTDSGNFNNTNAIPRYLPSESNQYIKTMTFETGGLDGGSRIVISSTSHDISLEKSYRVLGEYVSIPSGIVFRLNFTNSQQVFKKGITIVNYWQKGLEISPDIYNYKSQNDYGWQSFGSYTENYYNTTLYAHVYPADGSPPYTVKSGNPMTLKPGDKAYLYWVVKPTGNAANLYNYTYALKLTLSPKGMSYGMSRTVVYYANLTSNLPANNQPNQTNMNFEPGKYLVVRSQADPYNIHYQSSCLVYSVEHKSVHSIHSNETNKTKTVKVRNKIYKVRVYVNKSEMIQLPRKIIYGSYTNYTIKTTKPENFKGRELKFASICDANQMKGIIDSMINELSNSNEISISGGPYAFGNDVLTLNDLNDNRITSMKINDGTSSKDEITCGIVTLTITRTGTGEYTISGYLNSSTPWCQPGEPSFLVGLLNPDAEFSFTTERQYLLQSEGTPSFQTLIDKIRNKNPRYVDNLTSYIGSFISDLSEAGSNYYTIQWKSLDESRVGQSTETSWLQGKLGNYHALGFLRWYGPNSNWPDTYLMGVVTADDLGNIKNELEECFLENLMYHWLTGNETSLGIDEKNIDQGVTIPFNNCESPNWNIHVPGYNFKIVTPFSSEDVTGKWVNSSDLYILGTDNTTNIGYCYVGVGQLDTSKQVDWETLTQGYKLTGIEEGKNTVYMECFSGETNTPGPIITKNVWVDTKPPSILYTYSPTIPINLGVSNEATISFNVEDDGSGVSKCFVYPRKYLNGYNKIYKNTTISTCTPTSTFLGSKSKSFKCVIGGNDISNKVFDWLLKKGGGCKNLPLTVNASIVCTDNVGNEANKSITIAIGGNSIVIRPILQESCTILSDNTIKSDVPCLFSPASIYKNVYYTNGEGTVILKYNVKAAVSRGTQIQCWLDITKDGNEVNSTQAICNGPCEDFANGVNFTVPLSLGELREGRYNVTFSCTTMGKSSGGRVYDEIGCGCSEKDERAYRVGCQ